MDDLTLMDRSELKMKLYDPKYFLALAPLFSFILPGILFAMNYHELGEKKKSIISIIIIAAAGVLFFLGIILLGGLLGNSLKYVAEGINVAIGAGLYQLQSCRYKSLNTAEYQKRKFVFPILISLVPVAFLIYFTISTPTFKEYSYMGNKIYYDDKISVDEITLIGSILAEIEFLDSSTEYEFIVKLENHHYSAYFSIKEEFINSPELNDLENTIETEINQRNLLDYQFDFIAADENYKKY